MMGYIKGGLLVTGALIALWFYTYVNDMRAQLDLGIAKQAKSELIITKLGDNLTSMQIDIKESKKNLEELQEARKASKDKLDALESVLGKHDLAKIRNRKPELLRRAYERGTNKYYKEIRNVMEN